MQIVHDRRVPLERLLRHRLRQLEELPHAVAVVVVLHVLAPVHQRQPRVARRALLVEVVGVDLLLAAVDFDHRRDQRDDVVADVLDERRLFDDQAVGQLDQHLGAAGLRRVHAADRVVDRLGRVRSAAAPAPRSSCADRSARRACRGTCRAPSAPPSAPEDLKQEEWREARSARRNGISSRDCNLKNAPRPRFPRTLGNGNVYRRGCMAAGHSVTYVSGFTDVGGSRLRVAQRARLAAAAKRTPRASSRGGAATNRRDG